MEVGTVAVDPRIKNSSILCMVKVALLALVAVFVLYLPLGDPTYFCANTDVEDRKGTMCCLCQIYLMSVRVVSITIEMTEAMICALGDILYGTKLKFYSILEKIDREDLCRSICCSDSSGSIDVKRVHRHPPCRCTKKCSKKKSENI